MKAISKRLLGMFLFAVLLALPARAAFSDVPSSHWAFDSIRAAAERGLVNGMSADTFGLGQEITRAQYAAMLCRLMDWAPVSPERGSFSDNQDRDAWYFSAVETAYAHEVLLKLGDVCGPNEPLPREEMAAMTVRALGFNATFAGVVQDDCPFADVTSNPGYIALAYRMGFMNGVSENRFSPKTASTREQAAAVLLRVCDRLDTGISRLPLSALPAEANAVFVEPITNLTGKLPMCPRAPLENVYAAAVRAGAGGSVAIYTSPYLVTESGEGKKISPEELNALLEDEETLIYPPSSRYLSSYLVNGTDTVWYESSDNIAQKVELCRLMGVKTVYVE